MLDGMKTALSWLLAAVVLGAPAIGAPLDAAPVETAEQATRARLTAARHQQIERLRAYAAAGRFPRNHRILGQVPIFVDDDGRRCAVAHLMTLDGHGRAVAAIARRDRHLYVEDITDGPIAEWVRTSGLLVEEAALIQPGYSRWRGGASLEPVDAAPAEVEVARLRAHFEWVIATLEHHEARALDLALDRLAGAPLDPAR